MARGKRHVALFEVIGADKRFQRQKPPQSATTATTSPNPTPLPSIKPLRSAKIAAPPPILVKPAGPDFKTRFITSYRAAQARWARQSERLRPFLVRYAGAMIGIGSALTVMGGVLIARHALRPATSQAPLAALADQIRTETPHPEVLDVAVASTPVTPTPDTPDAPQPTVAAIPDQDTLSADAAQAQPASSVFTPTKRQINLNYVLVQSYGDEKTATEACDFLNKNGVPCTIEQGVKNWRKDFYLVIGLQGFPRVSGPDYVAYRKKIDELAAIFSPSPHSYKRFDPEAIKWDRAD